MLVIIDDYLLQISTPVGHVAMIQQGLSLSLLSNRDILRSLASKVRRPPCHRAQLDLKV